MKLEKQFAVAATQDRIWAFITDPNLIGPCIPGCQHVEVLSPGRYRASLKIQVGPIKTTFAVIVEARVERPPEYAEYTLQGEEGGKASRLSGVNTLAITRLTDTECEVKYTSEVNLVGRLGKFGSGVMQKISDNLGEKFAEALRASVEGERVGSGEAIEHISNDGRPTSIHLPRLSSQDVRMTIRRQWPEDVYVREMPSTGGKLYAQVVEATGSRSIFVAGCMPFDVDNQLVGDGDLHAQTVQVLDTVRRSLANFGAAPEHVVRTRIFVTDIEEYKRVGHREWVAFFGEHLPASTLVGVSALADPRVLVEIDADAILD